VPDNVKALLNCLKVVIFATRIINLDEDKTLSRLFKEIDSWQVW
jgi:hypothetical protein